MENHIFDEIKKRKFSTFDMADIYAIYMIGRTESFQNRYEHFIKEYIKTHETESENENTIYYGSV
ncbi:MAG: hypothetical protein AB7F64_06675 [Gammaproteobacteria bacterium]